MAPNYSSELAAVRLRCEHLPDPLGIDTAKPRLSWNLASARRNVRQSAYHVLVATSPEVLAEDQGDAWDSGEVESSNCLSVEYGGSTLLPAQRYYWKVRISDDEGNLSPWSDVASWQMGLLAEANWGGQWVGAVRDPTPAVDRKPPGWHVTVDAQASSPLDWSAGPLPNAAQLAEMDRNPGFAAVLIRKEVVTPAPPTSVTAFICGLGAYVLAVNGRRVSDPLEPAHSDYRHHVLYRAYDVTPYWREGANAVAVTLGNGWWHAPTDDGTHGKAPWRATPRLRLRVEAQLADGSRQVLVTDGSWKWRTGPITFNCIRGGEDYDARRERPGWDLPGYDEEGWRPVVTLPAPEGVLASELLYPVRVTETLEPVSVTPGSQKGEWVFDFGRNLAGWARLRTRGQAGQTVEMEFPGEPYCTFGRYQIDRYTLKGGGEEVYEPTFTHHGFRKVIVRGLSEEPTVSTLTACNAHSDLPSVGEFSCSDERLNVVQEVLRRTAQNYVLHYPADPTREKFGWLQDVMNFFAPQCYNFDSVLMYRKWLVDMLDSQGESGYVSSIAPTPGQPEHSMNGPWWAGMIIYLPWMLYQFYGDTRALEESYGPMKAFMGWLRSMEGKTQGIKIEGVWEPDPFGGRCGPGCTATDGLLAWGLGDWGEVGSVGFPSGRTPLALVETCAYAYLNRLLGEIAGVLGNEADARHYESESKRIAAALNRCFLDPTTGEYADGSQTAQILPLYLGLVPEDKRELVVARLRRSLSEAGDHLDTGFVGTPFLLTGLSEFGLHELAWKVATQPDYPGWFDVVFNRGATTFMEFWDASHVQMPSCQGSIGEWFFRDLAGVRPDPAGPGFRKIIVRPRVLRGLDWVKASYECPYGLVTSAWSRDGENLTVRVRIPPNTTATVYVPGQQVTEVADGDGPAGRSPRARSLGTQDGAAVFEIGSGDYCFLSGQPPIRAVM